jgi:hypothetical protein
MRIRRSVDFTDYPILQRGDAPGPLWGPELVGISIPRIHENPRPAGESPGAAVNAVKSRPGRDCWSKPTDRFDGDGLHASSCGGVCLPPSSLDLAWGKEKNDTDR